MWTRFSLYSFMNTYTVYSNPLRLLCLSLGSFSLNTIMPFWEMFQGEVIKIIHLQPLTLFEKQLINGIATCHNALSSVIVISYHVQLGFKALP